MKPSQLNAEYPAVDRTAFSDAAVSNSGWLSDFATVSNHRQSLKKQRLEPSLDVKPAAAFLGRHTNAISACRTGAYHVRVRRSQA